MHACMYAVFFGKPSQNKLEPHTERSSPFTKALFFASSSASKASPGAAGAAGAAGPPVEEGCHCVSAMSIAEPELRARSDGRSWPKDLTLYTKQLYKLTIANHSKTCLLLQKCLWLWPRGRYGPPGAEPPPYSPSSSLDGSTKETNDPWVGPKCQTTPKRMCSCESHQPRR